MSKEEADKEVKRIFSSFSDEFKLATVQLLRTKALARVKIIQRDLPGKTPIEQIEMAWAETALEMMMILTDALSKSALALQETDNKLKAVKHLMPEGSSRKQ